MREHGASEIDAWIGPHVCGSCYEVPEQMRAEVSAVVPEAFAETSWGTPALDIGAGVRAQLTREGVEVVDVAGCTLEDRGLHSYRRDGAAAGRFAGPGVALDDARRRPRGQPRRRTPPHRRPPAPPPADRRTTCRSTVVTKFFPASDVRILADLGVTDVGENRHQEAAAKAAECADLPLRWHFIGGLQSNKAAAVASLRRRRRVRRPGQAGAGTAAGCARARPRRRRAPAGQSRSAGSRAPFGRGPRRPWPRWPPRSRRPASLRLRGLMAVAPLGEDPDEAFARLAEIRAGVPREPPAGHRAVGRDEQ